MTSCTYHILEKNEFFGKCKILRTLETQPLLCNICLVFWLWHSWENTWRCTNTHKTNAIYQLSEIFLLHTRPKKLVIIQRRRKEMSFRVFTFCLTRLHLYNEEKHSSFKHAWNHRIVCIVYTWIAYMYPNHVIYSMSVWMSSVHVHFCAYCMCVFWCL